MMKKIFICALILFALILSGCIFNGTGSDTTAVIEMSDTAEQTTDQTVETAPQPRYISRVSNICDEKTKDILFCDGDTDSVVWRSSNAKLYRISDGTGIVDKAYQTHKEQKVTVSAVYTKDGEKCTESKEITVSPIKFAELPDTPVATYFQTSAMYAYKENNEFYKKDGTVFPEKVRETLDIVYYAFANLSPSGSVTIGDESYISKVNELRRDDVRVVLSVSGTSTESCQNFMNITANTKLLETFVKNLMDTIDRNRMDGIDIDWEAVSGTIRPNATGMNKLMKALREEMDKRQADGGTAYFLSCAVPASSWGTEPERFDFRTLAKYVDYVNIMSYDMNKTDTASHLSPLYPSEKDKGYKFGCVYGVERLISLGLPKNKMIIGCAGYGKTYKITGDIDSASPLPGLGQPGSYIQYKNATGYFKGTVFYCAIEDMINSGKFVKYTEYNKDGDPVGSYLINFEENVFVTYDSAEIFAEKYRYAKSMDGVGIMSWSYPEDTSNTYLNSVYAVMHEIID